MKIYLFCSGGMSTTLLVGKMEKIAKKQGIDCEITAFAESLATTKGKEADIVLIAPQIKFREKAIRKALQNKFIQLIDMRAYGLVNGEKVLADALTGYQAFESQ